ncbi:hypothetical protein PanWU01x14_289800 [Parasponia andersonii]|uniref:Uncharacterized protein n=1 Tax=Parasponia andersonii TaxID=3476 RepID=A0A2P5AY07_PARAD|nr:hypothetical protein PanWU01x14_289800 [Parasponia andersonii]
MPIQRVKLHKVIWLLGSSIYIVPLFFFLASPSDANCRWRLIMLCQDTTEDGDTRQSHGSVCLQKLDGKGQVFPDLKLCSGENSDIRLCTFRHKILHIPDIEVYDSREVF